MARPPRCGWWPDWRHPAPGTITLSGKDITYAKPYKRPVNTVFQSYALFPHLDIYENVAFGLRRRKTATSTSRSARCSSWSSSSSQARKKPAQLSGGQQQRVALARALINSPDVLLLDEPLGALDLKLRRSMQIEIKRIQTEVGRTFIHVTHDQEEAMTMADTVAVMNDGEIEQMGAPSELYENPRSTFVANFLGQSNLIEGTIMAGRGRDQRRHARDRGLDPRRPRRTRPGDRGWIGIRPEKVLIGDVGEALDAPGNTIPGGVVSDVSFVGVSTQYLVRMPWGQELQVFSQNTGRTRLFHVGDKVELSWRPEYAFLLDAAQDAFAGAQRADDDG